MVGAMAGLRLPIESHVLQAFVTEGLKPVLDQLYADPGMRGFGHRVAESVFDSKHTIFLRERMGPDFVYKP